MTSARYGSMSAFFAAVVTGSEAASSVARDDEPLLDSFKDPGTIRENHRMASQLASLGTNASRARFKSMNGLSNWPRNRLLLALASRDLNELMPELDTFAASQDRFL